MKKRAGLWIDHREATIVTITDGVEEIKHIESNSGKRIRYSGGAHSKTPEGARDMIAEDMRDRKMMNQLNSFYDKVIAAVRDVVSLRVFGPGEAKIEFEKRAEHEGLKDRIVLIETADKMTDRQIAAKVHEHLPA
jgi:hypothetical protein